MGESCMDQQNFSVNPAPVGAYRSSAFFFLTDHWWLLCLVLFNVGLQNKVVENLFDLFVSLVKKKECDPGISSVIVSSE